MTTIPTWLYTLLVVLSVGCILQAAFIYVSVRHAQNQKAMRNLQAMRGERDGK